MTAEVTAEVPVPTEDTENPTATVMTAEVTAEVPAPTEDTENPTATVMTAEVTAEVPVPTEDTENPTATVMTAEVTAEVPVPTEDTEKVSTLRPTTLPRMATWPSATGELSSAVWPSADLPPIPGSSQEPTRVGRFTGESTGEVTSAEWLMGSVRTKEPLHIVTDSEATGDEVRRSTEQLVPYTRVGASEVPEPTVDSGKLATLILSQVTTPRSLLRSATWPGGGVSGDGTPIPGSSQEPTQAERFAGEVSPTGEETSAEWMHSSGRPLTVAEKSSPVHAFTRSSLAVADTEETTHVPRSTEQPLSDTTSEGAEGVAVESFNVGDRSSPEEDVALEASLEEESPDKLSPFEPLGDFKVADCECDCVVASEQMVCDCSEPSSVSHRDDSAMQRCDLRQWHCDPRALAQLQGKRPIVLVKIRAHTHTHTHTHTQPFNDPLSGTTRVSRYQKG